MTDLANPSSFLQLILHIAKDFVHLSPLEVDKYIKHALYLIGEFCKADRVYLYQFKDDIINRTHIWCAEGIDPQEAISQIIDLQTHPCYREKFFGKDPVVIENVKALPEPMQTVFISRHIQSMLAIPMTYRQKQIGFLGFDSVNKLRQWDTDEVELLKIITDIFADALVQRSVVTRLRESEEQYRVLVENLNDGIVINQNDKFIFINKQFARMLGYDYNELFMAETHRVYSDESLEIIRDHQERCRRGELVSPRFEAVLKKKDGDNLDVELNVRVIHYKNALASFMIISDITGRKKAEMYQRKLEVDLLKRQKVSSMGIFAGGTVHNIRNTLSVITGRAQMLKQKMPNLKEPDIIIANASKIVLMADNYLKKTKREQVENIVDIDLNDLLKTEIVYMESNQYVKNQINIRFNLEHDIPNIRGHYIDYSHAISAIIEFSINAMVEAPVKELLISTDLQENKILLTISHSGRILPDEEMESIFTPFYSVRKFAGKGHLNETEVQTMQLFNAYILLEHYKVQFKVEKDINNRTLFSLRIPIT